MKAVEPTVGVVRELGNDCLVRGARHGTAIALTMALLAGGVGSPVPPGAFASESDVPPQAAPARGVAVSIESSPRNNRSAYRIGETISVAVQFDEPVAVDEDDPLPWLALTIGERERRATYAGGSGTHRLVFRYRVADGDADADGIAVAADALVRDDGPNGDGVGNPAPAARTPSLADQPGHRVDGERPKPSAGAVAAAGSEVSIVFDEILDADSVPPAEAFSVTVDDAAYPVTAVSVAGDSVSLTLSQGVPVGGSDVVVSYVAPVDESALPIRDTANNAAASFVSARSRDGASGADPAPRTGREMPVAERPSIGEILAQKALRTPVERKVSSRLLEARRDRVAAQRGGTDRADDGRGDDERVLVDIRADVTSEVLERIEALGGEVEDRHPRYRSIRARLTPEAALELAELDAVQTIRPADRARTHQTEDEEPPMRNTSEGDAAHAAPAARTTYAVDGTGIGIGVISNGIGPLSEQQASGDLPSAINVLPGQEGHGNEGAAMLEIVHDIAPGAELYFATASGGQARFAANIEALCRAGADIIVDDVYYSAEAVFQDDVIAQAVSAAVGQGCFYFSAAGNEGNLTDSASGVWEGDYVAGSAFTVDGTNAGTRHKFAADAEENALTTGKFGSGGDWRDSIVLQWADPWGASANDYDLFLVDSEGGVVASSTDTQSGSQLPVEIIETEILEDEDLRLVVVKVSGADRYLRLQALRARLGIATAGNTYGHAASADAFGIGAVDARTAGGTDGVFDGTESVQYYSSDGPRRMFFEADGTALTAGDFSATGGVLRNKPDFAAASCVTTATPGFSTFCGTSAAAPHAAAIAALALEAAGGPGQVTLAELRTAMATMALDIEAAGPDGDSGAGIVMAPAAVGALNVAVADRNAAPTVENPVRNRILAPDSEAVQIDLSSVFSDPDMDALTYSGQSSDPDRLAVSIATSTLTLTPGSTLGTAVVDVRAVDPDGLAAKDSFIVTISDGAAHVVDEDWSLVPDGVAPAGRFRLLFVSSTRRNSTSSDVADYNNHVQSAAAGGLADIRGYSSEFAAVVCTADTTVFANTGTSADDTDAPIYWLNPERGRDAVATGYTDFYDGLWGVGQRRNEAAHAGRAFTGDTAPIVGCLNDGTTLNDGLGGPGPMGTWLLQENGAVGNDTAGRNKNRSVFALSPMFVYVPTDDAALSTLSIDAAGVDLPLDAEFDPDTFLYELTVDDDTESLTLHFEARGVAGGAIVSVQDAAGNVLDDGDPDTEGFQVNLYLSRNVFDVVVTSPDGTTLTYRVVVSRNILALLTNQHLPRSNQTHDGSAVAQVFKTGNHAGGYLLDAVIVHLVNTADLDPATTYVQLWSIDETDLFYDIHTGQDVVLPWSRPGAPLHALASPDAFVDGPNRFTAPLGTVLEPDTYYYVIVNEAVEDGASVALSADYLVPAYDSDYGWWLHNHSYGPTFLADDTADRQAIPNSVVLRIEGGLLAASCPIDLNERTAIWWAQLTPAELAGGSFAEYGFDGANGEGDLSVTSFDFGGATYGITDLYVELTPPPFTYLGIEPRLPSEDVPALALHLCSRVLHLRDAAVLGPPMGWIGNVDDWSEGEVVTVALSASQDTFLSDLSVSGATLIQATTGLPGEGEGFEATKFDYTALVRNGRVTVTATANDQGALIAYLDDDGAAIADADGGAAGHQVDLDLGPNVVRIVVTSGDRKRRATYTVTIVREGAVLLTSEHRPDVSHYAENPYDFSQPFTTGSHPHGYRIDTVWLDTRPNWTSFWSSSRTVLRLTEDRVGGRPDLTCEVLALRSPRRPVRGLDAFAPAENTLKPDTTYHLVVNWGIPISQQQTRVNPDQSVGRAADSGFGWTLEHLLFRLDGLYPDWRRAATKRSLRLRISGCEVHPATQQALVSNTGEARETRGGITVSADTDGQQVALGFSTGDGTTGYTLASVQVHFKEWFDAADDEARVSIYTSSASGVPGSSLYVLTNPSIVNGQLNTFTAPADAVLRPQTEYFVVVEAVMGTFRLSRTTSGAEDPCEATGWALNDRLHHDAGTGWAEIDASFDKPLIAIEGTVHALVSGLSLMDAGGVSVPLNEEFDPATKEYTADVVNAVSRITVEPHTEDALATFEFLDAAGNALTDADGMAGGFQVDLAVGNNGVRVVATSGNGAATESYLVVVSRPATVPADWSLTPDGVPAGGRFRLLFVTSTGRAATSSDIADYNTHVRAAAAAGHADIQAYAARFTALASTASVDARDNTMTVASDADVPIYWLSETTTREAVATGYADFYDGLWDDMSVRTESGASTTIDDTDAGSVVTGSNLDGTAVAGGELGTSSVAGWWLSSGELRSRSAAANVSRRLLALSPVFEKDATTLVTNEAETPKSMQGAWWTAQAFTTGNHIKGYLLHAVWLDANAGTAYSAAETHVRIVPQKTNGDPKHDAPVADLASPATIAPGPDAFTAPPGTVLERRTTYFVVVNWEIVDWEARLKLVLTGSNRQQSEFGWGIDDTRRHHAEGDVEITTDATRSLSMRVTGREITNNAPVFNPTTTTRQVVENTTAVTALGDPIPEATDGDGDTLTYSMEGADAESFDFSPSSRQISTKAGVSYDFETKSSYTVEVKADDGNPGGTGTIVVTINVTDQEEKPDTPGAPAVTATSGKTDSLDVSWTAPGTNNGPDIVGYKLRYRKTVGAASWMETTPTGTDTETMIGGLDSSTEYEVQVQALNGETDSDWSASGTGTTSTPAPNRLPVFDPTTTTRTVVENAGADTAVGDPIPEATDDDGDDLTYTLEGADAGSFDFDPSSRQISTKAGESYDFEATKNTYTVEVKADDEKGGTGKITVTINVTDADEQPDTPDAPMVTAPTNVNDSLDVTWAAPGKNNGPDIVGYKLRHQKTDGGTWEETTLGLVLSRRIGGLDSGTEYEVQVQALNDETPSDWSASGKATTGNRSPVFDPATAVRSVVENAGADTAVGDPIPEATDDDGDDLTYTLEGADAGSFDFDPSSRQISTKAGESYDFEATKNTYTVEVKADDEKGGTGKITVTINVTDADEQPDTPDAPMVTAPTNVNDSLDVTWAAPGKNNGPDIVGYKLRHQKTDGGTWAETTLGLVLSRRIGGLDSGTEYEVQVQALNDETPSDWSASGKATTGNRSPVFDPATAVRSVVENAGADTAVGDPIPEATDDDGDDLTYTLEGADAGSFDFDPSSRQISTKAGESYDFEATKNTYTVEVKADDEKGGTGKITVTINVTDADEQPDTPDAPMVTAPTNVNDSLDVTWAAPGKNNGPDIVGYKLRHQKTDGGTWEETTLGLVLSRRIGGLDSGTEYEVQVQALNDETPSDWSASGKATTGNRSPVFDPATAVRSVVENAGADTAVGDPIPEATDDDGDDLTYTLEGADAGSFDFDPSSRQISTKAGESYDFEATKNTYTVEVKADDEKGGTGKITVTINVTDADEQPDTPDAPMVTAPTNVNDSLDVTWAAPGKNNGPDIVGYKLRHQKTDGGTWAETTLGLVLSRRIGGLDSGTEYEVQVQALNDETPSDWSASGKATTGNRSPVFDPATAVRSVVENAGADTAVGDPIPEATDDDGDDLTYTLEGADAGSFDFDPSSRQISTKAGESYDFEATKNTYTVEVKADDEKGGTGKITVTINVTDADEQPDTPDAPMVTAPTNVNDSLDVTWAAPGKNNGPDIVGYKLRHQKTDGGSWEETTLGLVLSRRIGGLDSGTEYEVQVQALNDETPSDWSASGKATTTSDEDRKPRRPAAPSVAAPRGEPDSLNVWWREPGLNGGPEIIGYELRYRIDDTGSWTETKPAGTGRAQSHKLTGLSEDTEYEVQVRALNGQIPSDWSPSGTGRTGSTPPCDLFMESVTVHEGETAAFTITISPPLAQRDVLSLGIPPHGQARADDICSSARFVDLPEGAEPIDYYVLPDETVEHSAAWLPAGTTQVTGEVEICVDEVEEPTEMFQIRMRWDSLNQRPDWRDLFCHGRVYIRDGTENAPPEFAEGAAATRRVDENTSPGRALGRPFAADDHNGDPVTYALEGADAASFDLDRNTGQLRTRAALDHEARDAYAVVVKAQDDHGGEATIEVAVSVDDVPEQPATPAAPAVAAAADRGGALDVSWTKPGLAGGPEIVGYVLRWGLADDPDSGGVAREYPAAARSARIEGLRENTEYAVRVRALNGETPSEWSEPGTGRTGGNGPPVFAEGERTTRSVAENATEDTWWEPRVGEPVVAEDPEGDHVTYSLAGPDGDRLFRIDSQTGQLRVRLSTVLNHEAKSSYVLTVRAEATLARSRGEDEDNDGGSAEIEVTVEVEDVEEPPGTPRSVRVWTVPGSATSASVIWTPGENKGPRMAYDVRYREAGGGSWTDGPMDLPWFSTVLTGLSAGIEYEAQARARSDEGESGWSSSGRGSTDPDGAERSVAMDPVSVHEGETARFSIEISPAPEAGDDLRLSWRTDGREASEGQDFRSAGVSGIVLAAGQTEVAGEVETLADDRDNEGRERFRIAIELDDWGGGDPTIRTGGNILIEDGPRPAPAAPTAWVAGDRLTLRYADALEAGPAPGPKDWVVRAETAAAARTLAVAGASVSGREVVLELSPPAAAGESVSVSYLPWSMRPLRGADGAELAPLTELEARNETPASAPADAPRVGDGAPGAAAAERPPAARDAPVPAPLPPLAATATRLDLSDLGLADAAALAGLSRLEVLDLSGNRLADAWPLAGLGALRRLDLSDNRLADVAALADLPRLEVLDLSGNRIADAWPLAGLAALRRLDLSDNRLADVAALAGLPNLEVLVLDGNGVADVLPLALLPRLARLDLSGNRVADALLLAELRALARLDLAGNRLADADPLGDLSRLVWLDLSGNPVSDLAPLGRLAALRWLWLDARLAGSEALAPLRERPEPVRIDARPPTGPPAPSAVPGGQAPGTP